MASRRNFLLKTAAVAGSGFIFPDSFAASPGAGIKSQFLIPSSRVYLNTGTLGSSPLPVIRTIEENMRLLEADPAGENWGTTGNRMEVTREKIAQLTGASKDEILLTGNTTEGLNLVSSSIILNKGDEVVTTTMEHGGAEVGLEYLCKISDAALRKIELPLIPSNPEQLAESVISQLSAQTRVLLLSHVNTITGLVMPFYLLKDHCRKAGIFLIADGAQSVGQIPVNVVSMGVDAFAASGHKWLLGPKETGFLYLKKEHHEKIKPVFMTDGFASYTRSTGTRNASLIIGLGAAVDWIQNLGVEHIRSHGLKLRELFAKELGQISGCEPISPENNSLSTCIFSFSLERLSNTDVAAALNKKDIRVKVLPRKNAIRISFAPYNSEEDVAALVSALRAEIR